MEWTTLRDFSIALLIGALVGTERESRKAKNGQNARSGLRTFILLAMAGAVSAWLGARLGTPWFFIATLLIVAGSMTASYIMTTRVQPDALGITTEAGALCVCMLGGMTMLGYPELAVSLGIVTTAVLAYKEPMHGLVSKLGRDDINAGLRLLIASFIVLPLIPHRAIDPWSAINPYNLWLLVVMISALSLVGYIATRWLGPGRGTMLTGLTGGLVSSTAVTLSFARGARDSADRNAGDTFAVGIMIAWAVMVVRVIVEVAVVNPAMVSSIAVPLVAMGLAGLSAAAFFYWRNAAMRQAVATFTDVPLKNPFSLTKAATFGLIFAIILLAVKIAESQFSSHGLYLVSFLAGLTDVDAITLSLANLAKSGGDQATAVNAITLAAMANTLGKCALVFILSSRALKNRILPASLAIILAGAIALYIGVGPQ
jgi:uncharacterized membrane protein (DUF4010 family)